MSDLPENAAPRFRFSPRWKEELVCPCELGSLVLEIPMGVTSVYLPTEAAWKGKAPAWAVPFWAELHGQLARWCAEQRYPLYLDETAMVYATGE